MKNTVLNQKQRDLVNEYYEFSKMVVASSFHFADGKDISTGYSLEDAYQEGAVALCTAALHFNADKGVSFKTYAATVTGKPATLYRPALKAYALYCCDGRRVYDYKSYNSQEIYAEQIGYGGALGHLGGDGNDLYVAEYRQTESKLHVACFDVKKRQFLFAGTTEDGGETLLREAAMETIVPSASTHKEEMDEVIKDVIDTMLAA